MPAGPLNPQLQWIRVNDFSPGIRHLVNTSITGAINFSPQPQGVASIQNTTGCEALPGGGLGPLPWNPVSIAAGPAPVSSGNTEFNRLAITGFHVPNFARAWSPPEAPATGQDILSELWVGVGTYDTANPHVYNSYIQRLRLFRATPTYDNINTLTFNTGKASNTEVYSPVYLGDYRTTANGTAGGYPVVVLMNSQPGVVAQIGYTFPSTLTPFTNSTDTLNGGAAVGESLTVHQQRVIWFNWTAAGAGVVGSSTVYNDNIGWTNPVANTAQSVNNNFISSAGESFAIAASANAAELTLICLSQGAYSIQGDINNPSVTRYEAVQGTNGCFNGHTFVPGLGIVYGSQNQGVWAYPGGQAARKISPQLPGDFWQMSTTVGWPADFNFDLGGPTPNILSHFGKFAYANGYLICPNNWVYNIASNSWWRLGGTACAWWDKTPQGYIVGSPVYSSNIYGSAPNTPATTWQWQSQPIMISQDDNWTSVRELVFYMQSGKSGFSNSTFTVSITSYPNQVTQNISAQNVADDGFVHAVQLNTLANIKGTHVVLNITGTGSSGGAAPTMHEFRLGVQSDQQPIAPSN